MVGSSASIVSYRFFAPVVCLVLIYVVVDHLGPQTKFPVPEGILNYQGQNFIAITLWAQQEEGAKLEGLELVRNGFWDRASSLPSFFRLPFPTRPLPRALELSLPSSTPSGLAGRFPEDDDSRLDW